MLISFEGIDGCGKSTQIDLLKSYLESSDVEYSIFREPGGTEISEKIRSLLLHEAGEMNEITELLLFSAARSQLISEKVKPLLHKNRLVILDRFFDSTTAYQGYGRNSATLDQIHTLNQLAAHQTAPDLTFYLEIDPLDAQKRTESAKKDRMERAGLSFFRKVAEGYNQLAKNNSRFVTVDASQLPEIIHKKITETIWAHPLFPV